MICIIDKAAAVIQSTNPFFKGTRVWAQKYMWRMTWSLGEDLDCLEIASCTGAKDDSLPAVSVGYDYPKELIGYMDKTPMYFDIRQDNN